VNIAIPTIERDLHASGAGIQLIVAGYTIAYAVLLITGARLGSLFGYRRLFTFGLATFTVASLACGLAPGETVLIVFRAVQGAGAAMMVPQVFSLIQQTFDGQGRARALSMYGAVIALGALVGQVFGGVIVTADVLGQTWRPVFLVNVPIGAILLVIVPRILPEPRRSSSRRMDLPGLGVLALTVLMLVVPLVLGREAGWPAWSIASLVATVPMALLFAAIEWRVERRGGFPLVGSRVLSAPGMLAGIASIAFGMAAFGGFMFSTALHLQAGLGYSPLAAAMTFAPSALGFAISSLNWRRIPADWHRASIVLGFGVAGIGYLVLGSLFAGGSNGWPLLPLVLVTIGLGMGLGFSPVLSVALAHVALADAPDASGVLTTVIQLGQVIGVSVFGSIYLSSLTGHGAVASASALGLTDVGVAISMAGCVASALVLANSRGRVGAPRTVERSVPMPTSPADAA
jgi:MFS family permease